MRLPVLLTLFALFVAGCDESPVGVAPIPVVEEKAWIGSYSGGSGQGDVILDLTQTGSTLSGKVVFGSPTEYFRVAGAVYADSVSLTLDPKYFSDPSDFSVRAQVLANGGLSGTISYVPAGLAAGLTCRLLPRRSIDTHTTHNVPFGISGMVFDGSRLWLSDVTHYILMDPDGTLADTVVIRREEISAIWTSDTVMYDGSLLWGVFGISIMGPGDTTNVADLLAFTADGRAPDSLRLGHRPAGLAHDGAHSWSLRSGPPALIQFDGTGAVTDSLHVGIPDAYRLVFDGTHFWTLGWFLERLFEVDVNGEVLAMCDLPPSNLDGLPTGLAVEGSHIWYSESWFGAAVLHRMTFR